MRRPLPALAAAFAAATGGLARDYARSRDGAIAVIFIVALIPLLAAAGAAIDISRAYVVKQRLGYAVDAAGLAVGASTGTEAELQQILERYFTANYPAEEIGVPATPSMVISGNNITVTATAEVSATLMRIMGVDNIDVSAEAEIVRKVTGLDVALVLDNSTSMAGTKIASLKTAATSFVNILFGDDTSSTTLQIGVVPFSSTVNIGTSNSSYTLDASTKSVQVCSGYGWNRTCTNEDVDPYNYGSNTWGGCIEARTNPLDTEDSYTGSDSSKKWRKYAYSVSSPNRYCVASMLPLTGTKQTVLDKITEMEANGYTHINFGAMWGWRVVSPSEPFTQAHDYDDPKFNHAVVIMTDGENYMGSGSVYTAYGYLSDGRLGTTTSTSAAEDELDARLGDVCDGMKALGIVVYTITFDVTSQDLRDLMSDCATDDDHYYDSPSESELQSAFEAIGAQLSNLRLGR